MHCIGRITSDTTQSLKATVKPLFSESKRVVLDLTDVTYLDSYEWDWVLQKRVKAQADLREILGRRGS